MSTTDERTKDAWQVKYYSAMKSYHTDGFCKLCSMREARHNNQYTI